MIDGRYQVSKIGSSAMDHPGNWGFGSFFMEGAKTWTGFIAIVQSVKSRKRSVG
jgi:hypothetical protein